MSSAPLPVCAWRRSDVDALPCCLLTNLVCSVACFCCAARHGRQKIKFNFILFRSVGDFVCFVEHACTGTQLIIQHRANMADAAASKNAGPIKLAKVAFPLIHCSSSISFGLHSWPVPRCGYSRHDALVIRACTVFSHVSDLLNIHLRLMHVEVC